MRLSRELINIAKTNNFPSEMYSTIYVEWNEEHFLWFDINGSTFDAHKREKNDFYLHFLFPVTLTFSQRLPGRVPTCFQSKVLS